MSKFFKIDVVSDNICPWCYVGKRRLEKAMQKFKKEHVDVAFEVQWHPFYLDPTLSSEGVDKMASYKAKFGEARMAQMLPYMQQIGKAEDIDFSYGGKVAHTLNSHRLVDWAAQFGLDKQDATINALFNAYFEREQNLGDEAVLVQAATTAGLDADAAQAYLRSGDGTSAVEAEVREYMTKYRVSGVPFFIVQLLQRSSAASDDSSADASGVGTADVVSTGEGGVACDADGVCEARPAAKPVEGGPVEEGAGASGKGDTKHQSAEAAPLTSRYTASGAQEVEYFVQLFEHLKDEADKSAAAQAATA